MEHAAFYFRHFLGRRFDIPAFADTTDLYRIYVSVAPLPPTGVDVFARVIDPHARLDPARRAIVPNEVDRFTVAALYCDQVALPDDYHAILEQQAGKPDYAPTHVALAIAWLDENGCPPPPRELRERVLADMAAGVRIDADLSDIEIERAAFLYYLGRPDLVPSGFPASLLQAQGPDGGWPLIWPIPPGGRGSFWHPTVMALWVLLESEGRSNGAPMIPPSAS